MRKCAFGFAELERSQAIAVQGNVDVGRIRIEILAQHEARFSMLIGAGFEKRNVGREREIAAGFGEAEMKGIFGGPHVLAAGVESVNSAL